MAAGSSDTMPSAGSPEAAANPSDLSSTFATAQSNSLDKSHHHKHGHNLRIATHKQQQQQQKKQRQQRRGLIQAVKLPVQAVGGKLKRSLSRKQQQLRHLPNDALCLRMFNGLLPDQVISEVRDELRGGQQQLAAVEHVAKRRLARLAGADVGKLFLATAGSTSACCGVVHAAKGLLCFVAKPLRLRRPVGLLVNNVILPTSLYGPMLCAYLAVMAAKGALRQLAAEAATEEQKAGQVAATAAAAAAQLQESAAPDAAAAAAAAVENDSPTHSHTGGLTAKRIAKYQEAVRTSSSNMSDKLLPLPSSPARAGSSGFNSASQQQQQKQKQQKQKGGPWWAVWRERRDAADTAAAAAVAPAPAGPPADAPAGSDTQHQQHHSSTSTAQHPPLSIKGAPTPPTPHRHCAELAAQHSGPAAAAASADCPAAGQDDSSSELLAAVRTRLVPPSSESDNQFTEHPESAASLPDPEAAQHAQQDSWPHAEHAEHAEHEAISSPTASPTAEWEGQVSKLQRRWSSCHDNDPLMNEAALSAPLLLAPFRPPVFSRLLSGKGGCRITSAAAAVTGEEQQQCGGSCCTDGCTAAAAGKETLDVGGVDVGGVMRTVSLDLTAERRAMLWQQQQQLGSAARQPGSAAAADDVGVHTPSSRAQERQHRLYSSMDWGQKLLATPAI